MSTALQSDLASKSIDQSISELNSRSRDKSSAADESISIGPFGVFTVPSEVKELCQNEVEANETLESVPSETTELAAQSVGSFESPNDLHDWLDWQDLFNLDYQFPDLEVVDGEYGLNAEQLLPVDQHHVMSETLQPQSQIQFRDQSKSTSWPEPLKPADAETLLNHFKYNVVPQLVSIPLGGKSVWDVTVVNSAILTLAKVTYMTSEHISKAELANLLAICATSAVHLSAQHGREGKDDAQHWAEFAAQSIQQARQNLQWSLLHETKGLETAKYKDQLMATFAVINHSILYDYQQEARSDMLESERLLRFRGLAKPYISRKARLLHHLYSWVRIVGESTYVLHDYKNGLPHKVTGVSRHAGKRRREEGAGQNSKTHEQNINSNPRLDDFLRLQPNMSEAEQIAVSREDGEAGIRDIHYEHSSDRKGTLYMQLYGISENWLSLVSQTTRLANVLDSFKASQQRNIDMLESLERRKMRLEQMVCSFAMADASDHQIWNASRANDALNDEMANLYAGLRSQMIRAFNSSLTIFFYRRVRNVSPWILQEHVEKVIRALQDFKISCERYDMNGPGSPWPSFIAGCEAMSTSQREYFKTWFDSAFELTGFTRFQTAKTCMIEVWQHRDSLKRDRAATGDVIYSWIHLLQEKRIHVMLA